jgi:hypothetical protein
MKSMITLLVAFVVAVLFSCGDEGDPKTSASLEGKWKVKSLEYFQCTGGTANSLRECGTFTFCATWEFKSDGSSVITYDGGGTSTSTYTLYPNNTVGFCTSSCSNMSYSISGNKLTLTTILPASNDCMMKYIFEKM